MERSTYILVIIGSLVCLGDAYWGWPQPRPRGPWPVGGGSWPWPRPDIPESISEICGKLNPKFKRF